MRIYIGILLGFIMSWSYTSKAMVHTFKYGNNIVIESDVANAHVAFMQDSMFRAHPLMATKHVVSDIQLTHIANTKTSDFYLLLSLCIMLGLIRYIDRRYFFNLWLTFWNPSMNNRQIKEQLQAAGLQNFLMNIFFFVTSGAYLYYVIDYYSPISASKLPPGILILLLVFGTALLYASKFLAIRFSGWAFRVQGVTEQYIFNVFLINKVLAVILVPFIIVMAFASYQIVQQFIVISFIVAGILLLNRYIRSWQVFGSFFQFSKFHFFMYLCASEILPLAVLMKLLINGLWFY